MKLRDYILFLDTETSGLPKKWNKPYSEKDNWPYSVQISWVVYSNQGEFIKEENYFVNNNDFIISKKAYKIHGIDQHFLTANGTYRQGIMLALTQDLEAYKPLLVGHFMKLDLHMIGAEFYRAGMKNPAIDLPAYCTMLGTTHLVQNPALKFLRLGDLYKLLLNKTLENQHNALVDAKATATCFFDLLKKGEINPTEIEKQQLKLAQDDSSSGIGCTVPVLIALFLMMILAYLL